MPRVSEEATAEDRLSPHKRVLSTPGQPVHFSPSVQHFGGDMRHSRKAGLAALAAAFSAAVFVGVHSAYAQVDFWKATNGSGNLSGTWNSANNWSLGNIPTNVETADFTQQDATTTSTVTLDGSFTIGAINFGDTNT